MNTYIITNLNKPHNLAKKMRRYSNKVVVRGTSLVVDQEDRPWGILAGHMTETTWVRQTQFGAEDAVAWAA